MNLTATNPRTSSRNYASPTLISLGSMAATTRQLESGAYCDSITGSLNNTNFVQMNMLCNQLPPFMGGGV
jgi:hypothetical protein